MSTFKESRNQIKKARLAYLAALEIRRAAFETGTDAAFDAACDSLNEAEERYDAAMGCSVIKSDLQR